MPASPSIMSLWPPIYFVALWTVMSAPMLQGGFWLYGEAKVASTTVRAPASLAFLETSGMSVTPSTGLLMDSTYTRE